MLMEFDFEILKSTAVNCSTNKKTILGTSCSYKTRNFFERFVGINVKKISWPRGNEKTD